MDRDSSSSSRTVEGAGSPLHCFSFQLFTEYGRLAMEETCLKPFQVSEVLLFLPHGIARAKAGCDQAGGGVCACTLEAAAGTLPLL